MARPWNRNPDVDRAEWLYDIYFISELSRPFLCASILSTVSPSEKAMFKLIDAYSGKQVSFPSLVQLGYYSFCAKAWRRSVAENLGNRRAAAELGVDAKIVSICVRYAAFALSNCGPDNLPDDADPEFVDSVRVAAQDFPYLTDWLERLGRKGLRTLCVKLHGPSFTFPTLEEIAQFHADILIWRRHFRHRSRYPELSREFGMSEEELKRRAWRIKRILRKAELDVFWGPRKTSA